MSQKVTLDELYRRSSQYRLWSFTSEELAENRRKVNEKGRLKVDERLREAPVVDPTQIEKVTVEEELQLIAFHSRRISALARHFNMPSQVRATAVSFLRKFYLVNSVMEYHPKLVLLTCLFLAAKSENYFISISTFCKRIPKTTPESILSLEFEILQSLQFTLLTHHPFRPLYGFFFDIQEVLQDEYSTKELGSVYDEARKLIDETLISDAVYQFTPPQIALACFKQVNSKMVLKYLEKKFKASTEAMSTIKEEEEEETPNIKKEEGANGTNVKAKSQGIVSTEKKTENLPVYSDLLDTVQQCQDMINSALNPSKEKATIIDRKVQYCLNPSLVLKRKRDDAGSAEDSSKKLRLESVEVSGSSANVSPTPNPPPGSN